MSEKLREVVAICKDCSMELDQDNDKGICHSCWVKNLKTCIDCEHPKHEGKCPAIKKAPLFIHGFCECVQ